MEGPTLTGKSAQAAMVMNPKDGSLRYFGGKLYETGAYFDTIQTLSSSENAGWQNETLKMEQNNFA